MSREKLFDLDTLQSLGQCFMEDFTQWIEKSNHPHISSLRKGIRISFLPITVLEALEEILDVILVEPDADFFWYNYKSKLTWATPDQQEVHGQSIQVNQEKIKSFLRDIKLNKILNEN